MPRRHDTQHDADAAEALLENATLLRAREAVKEALVNRIVAGDATQPDTDHELANLLRASELYWKILRGYLRSGEVELHNIEQARRDVA